MKHFDQKEIVFKNVDEAIQFAKTAVAKGYVNLVEDRQLYLNFSNAMNYIYAKSRPDKATQINNEVSHILSEKTIFNNIEEAAALANKLAAKGTLALTNESVHYAGYIKALEYIDRNCKTDQEVKKYIDPIKATLQAATKKQGNPRH